MNKEKGGELRGISVKEVSVVDAPANRRKWLFFKSDLKKADADIRIQSDGTLEGTKITVNGVELEDLTSFYFSYYKPAEDEELYIDPVSCNYTVTSDAEGGFHTSQTYDLAKAEGKLKMDYAKLGAFVKALTGKDVTQEQFQKLDESTLHELFVLSQYEGQMPTELSKAVGHFLKVGASADPPGAKPAETSEETPADKTGESEAIPADSMEELKQLRDKLDVLITGKKPESPGTNAEVLAKISGIAERIATLEKDGKPATEPKDEQVATTDQSPEMKEILELLKGIENRLEVVEKSSGIEKGASEGGGGGGDEEVDHYTSIPL